MLQSSTNRTQPGIYQHWDVSDVASPTNTHVVWAYLGFRDHVFLSLCAGATGHHKPLEKLAGTQVPLDSGARLLGTHVLASVSARLAQRG